MALLNKKLRAQWNIQWSPKSPEEKPYFGMLFESATEALEFYNAIAMVGGFRIQKGQVNPNEMEQYKGLVIYARKKAFTDKNVM